MDVWQILIYLGVAILALRGLAGLMTAQRIRTLNALQAEVEHAKRLEKAKRKKAEAEEDAKRNKHPRRNGAAA